MTEKKRLLSYKLDRRSFLKYTGVLGAAVGSGSILSEGTLFAQISPAPRYSIPGPDPVDSNPKVSLIRSTCLMCQGRCGIQALVADRGGPNERLLKIDGNWYHPSTRELQPGDFQVDPFTIKQKGLRGALCAKGQAGMEQVYTPIRIKKPLKRVGPRGSGMWQAITWEQFFQEVVEGGELPAPDGQGTYRFEGLRALRSDEPIDPEAPELGPKRNQVAHCIGRMNEGRRDFFFRFFRDAFGTVNFRNDHTGICELSHHTAHSLVFSGKRTLEAEEKPSGIVDFKPDILNAQYLLYFGASPIEANFPMVAHARKIVRFRRRGGKLVVVEPRFSNSAAKADEWIPIIPGTDAALALGMARWIIENRAYDEVFLRNPSKEAAASDGETSWTDATYLVKLDSNGRPGPYLQAKEVAGVGRVDPGVAQGKYASSPVVMKGGELWLFNTVEDPDLEVDTQITLSSGENVKVKSVFQLLKERVFEKSLEEYARICFEDDPYFGAATIARLASEFSSAGKKAAAAFYRGPVKHTNGAHNAHAILILNLLMGNVDQKGGYVKGGGSYHEMGGARGNPYNLSALFYPAKTPVQGPTFARDGLGTVKRYEETTEFKKKGYPAQRPWFPFTSNVWQEFFAGIVDGYPYRCKALFLSMANPLYSVPAGATEVLKVFTKTEGSSYWVPLIVTLERVMSETAKYCDYIIPDTGYLEQYATPYASPVIQTTVSGFRIPVVRPPYPDVKTGEEVLIEIAKRLGLPGFGKDGFGPGMDLNTPEDWYMKMFVNIAMEGTPVPALENPDEAMRSAGFTEAEIARMKSAIKPEEWPYLAYCLLRGGRFEDPSEAYQGMKVKHRYAGLCQIYWDKVATSRNSMTGEYFDGLPAYEPIKDAKGNLVDDSDYPFILVTHKVVWHTQSRTAENQLLVSLMRENYVEIHRKDAERLGIQTGDLVRVWSKTNPKGVVGRARVTEGIRPGVINVPHSFGHWEYGSQPWKVINDPQPLPGGGFPVPGKWDNSWYGAGVTANPILRIDESIGSAGLSDPIGGSASFFDTRVNIAKI